MPPVSMLRLALVVLIAGSACATGGGGVEPPIDARVVDARSGIDAPPLVDAFVTDAPAVVVDAPSAVDAPGGGLFCSGNGECTVAGECCFALGGPGVCVPGTVFLGGCIPD